MAKRKLTKKKPAAPRVTRGGKRVVSDPELQLAAAKVKTKQKAKAARATKDAKKTAPKTRPSKPKGPRSQLLPGMEQVTNRVLNNACETIADGRGYLSRGRDLEKEGMGIALQEMQRRGITGYRHSGVELAFVPGVDKLRVRMTEDAEHATGASQSSTTVEESGDAPGAGDPTIDDEQDTVDAFGGDPEGLTH